MSVMAIALVHPGHRPLFTSQSHVRGVQSAELGPVVACESCIRGPCPLIPIDTIARQSKRTTPEILGHVRQWPSVHHSRLAFHGEQEAWKVSSQFPKLSFAFKEARTFMLQLDFRGQHLRQRNPQSRIVESWRLHGAALPGQNVIRTSDKVRVHILLEQRSTCDAEQWQSLTKDILKCLLHIDSYSVRTALMRHYLNEISRLW